MRKLNKKPEEQPIKKPEVPQEQPISAAEIREMASAAVTPKTLEYIRSNALRDASRRRQLIAELDAFSADIAATLAFLKAQEK